MANGAGIEGMILGKYKIIQKLGSGAMGAVFKAQNTENQQVVALKILSPKLAKDEQYLKRFQREVRAARELQHPNIIAVYDAGAYKGFHYFTMEFIEGESALDYIEREKKFPIPLALKIIYYVAKALDHAHSKNIVHRDIKPANIMISRNGVVKLADMGLAKKIGEGAYTQITMAGRIMGTPYYLAPERISQEGDKSDTRADIYSLGATFYHMIVGRVPFVGDPKKPFQIYHDILNRPVEFPPEANIPSAIQGLIQKMMAKSPQQRFQTPRELLQTIEELFKAARKTQSTASSATSTASATSAKKGCLGVSIFVVFLFVVVVFLAVSTFFF
ncbi:MAG: serine/threonine protein kinase [Planctomycetota bacterium]|nr:MAG: serine/threonine protein kinase [Planctomycetota bacterium]